MTNDELLAIEARANAATAGPWMLNLVDPYKPDSIYDSVESDAAQSRKESYARSGQTRQVCCLDDDEYIANANKANDAPFIAHARSDIPALVAEVRRLQAMAIEAGGLRRRIILECRLAAANSADGAARPFAAPVPPSDAAPRSSRL